MYWRHADHNTDQSKKKNLFCGQTCRTRHLLVPLPWQGVSNEHPQHMSQLMRFSTFVLCKLMLRTRMLSHPVRLDVWFSVGPFVYFHTSSVRIVKALARLCGPEDYIQTTCTSPDHREYVQSFKKIGIKFYEELRSQGTHCLYTFIESEVRK